MVSLWPLSIQAAKVQNKVKSKERKVKKYLSPITFHSFRPKFITVCHKLAQNIPDIWSFPSTALPLHSEMFNLSALRNEYEHETKNSYRHSICRSQSAEARYVVGHTPLELV